MSPYFHILKYKVAQTHKGTLDIKKKYIEEIHANLIMQTIIRNQLMYFIRCVLKSKNKKKKILFFSL